MNKIINIWNDNSKIFITIVDDAINRSIGHVFKMHFERRSSIIDIDGSLCDEAAIVFSHFNIDLFGRWTVLDEERCFVAMMIGIAHRNIDEFTKLPSRNKELRSFWVTIMVNIENTSCQCLLDSTMDAHRRGCGQLTHTEPFSISIRHVRTKPWGRSIENLGDVLNQCLCLHAKSICSDDVQGQLTGCDIDWKRDHRLPSRSIIVWAHWTNVPRCVFDGAIGTDDAPTHLDGFNTFIIGSKNGAKEWITPSIFVLIALDWVNRRYIIHPNAHHDEIVQCITFKRRCIIMRIANTNIKPACFRWRNRYRHRCPWSRLVAWNYRDICWGHQYRTLQINDIDLSLAGSHTIVLECYLNLPCLSNREIVQNPCIKKFNIMQRTHIWRHLWVANNNPHPWDVGICSSICFSKIVALSVHREKNTRLTNCSKVWFIHIPFDTTYTIFK